MYVNVPKSMPGITIPFIRRFSTVVEQSPMLVVFFEFKDSDDKKPKT